MYFYRIIYPLYFIYIVIAAKSFPFSPLYISLGIFNLIATCSKFTRQETQSSSVSVFLLINKRSFLPSTFAMLISFKVKYFSNWLILSWIKFQKDALILLYDLNSSVSINVFPFLIINWWSEKESRT